MYYFVDVSIVKNTQNENKGNFSSHVLLYRYRLYRYLVRQVRQTHCWYAAGAANCCTGSSKRNREREPQQERGLRAPIPSFPDKTETSMACRSLPRHREDLTGPSASNERVSSSPQPIYHGQQCHKPLAGSLVGRAHCYRIQTAVPPLQASTLTPLPPPATITTRREQKKRGQKI